MSIMYRVKKRCSTVVYKIPEKGIRRDLSLVRLCRLVLKSLKNLTFQPGGTLILLSQFFADYGFDGIAARIRLSLNII